MAGMVGDDALDHCDVMGLSCRFTDSGEHGRWACSVVNALFDDHHASYRMPMGGL